MEAKVHDSRINRRDFIGGTSLTALGAVLSGLSATLSLVGCSRKPSERINGTLDSIYNKVHEQLHHPTGPSRLEPFFGISLVSHRSYDADACLVDSLLLDATSLLNDVTALPDFAEKHTGWIEDTKKDLDTQLSRVKAWEKEYQAYEAKLSKMDKIILDPNRPIEKTIVDFDKAIKAVEDACAAKTDVGVKILSVSGRIAYAAEVFLEACKNDKFVLLYDRTKLKEIDTHLAELRGKLDYYGLNQLRVDRRSPQKDSEDNFLP